MIFFPPKEKFQRGVYLYKEPAPNFFSLKNFFSLLPVVFISIGISLIAWVAYPIISFQLFWAPRFSSLVRPIPEQIIVQAMENEERVLGLSKEKEISRQAAGFDKDADLTRASNWFPQKPPEASATEKLEYTLSIPKLQIENALVRVGGEALDKSLVHYGGTALPGEWGNAVVFGHSVLPQFFDPKNYKTIFSTLPKIEEKDKILVNFDGIVYTYKIYQLRIVSPDDVSVLEQRYDSSYLSLVTCVPPGTYWKRLIVKARLEKI